MGLDTSAQAASVRAPSKTTLFKTAEKVNPLLKVLSIISHPYACVATDTGPSSKSPGVVVVVRH